VGWDKGEFPGRAALEAERADGPRRLLHGLITDGRQPPREGATILVEGPVGTVSSGNFSPMLERGVALGFLDATSGLAIGDKVAIEVRGKELAATLAELPLWPQKAAA
jgi:aminomethyltransferase